MIYVVRAGGTDLYKIGFTNGRAENRMRDLQVGCPFELRLVGTMQGTAQAERALHHRFRAYSKRGEWFEMPAEIIAELLGDASRLGVGPDGGAIRNCDEHSLNEIVKHTYAAFCRALASGDGPHMAFAVAMTEVSNEMEDLRMIYAPIEHAPETDAARLARTHEHVSDAKRELSSIDRFGLRRDDLRALRAAVEAAHVESSPPSIEEKDAAE